MPPVVTPPMIPPPMPRPLTPFVPQPQGMPQQGIQPPAVHPQAAPAPQPTPDSGPLAGVKKFFSSIKDDPNKMGFLFALGNSLTQPMRPGMNPAAHISNALMNGYVFMGLMNQAKQQRLAQEKEAGLKERQVVVQERGAETAERRAATAEEGVKLDREFNKERLDLEKRKFDETRRQFRIGLDNAQRAAGSEAEKRRIESVKFSMTMAESLYKERLSAWNERQEGDPPRFEDALKETTEQLVSQGVLDKSFFVGGGEEPPPPAGSGEDMTRVAGPTAAAPRAGLVPSAAAAEPVAPPALTGSAGERMFGPAFDTSQEAAMGKRALEAISSPAPPIAPQTVEEVDTQLMDLMRQLSADPSNPEVRQRIAMLQMHRQRLERSQTLQQNLEAVGGSQ